MEEKAQRDIVVNRLQDTEAALARNQEIIRQNDVALKEERRAKREEEEKNEKLTDQINDMKAGLKTWETAFNQERTANHDQQRLFRRYINALERARAATPEGGFDGMLKDCEDIYQNWDLLSTIEGPHGECNLRNDADSRVNDLKAELRALINKYRQDEPMSF